MDKREFTNVVMTKLSSRQYDLPKFWDEKRKAEIVAQERKNKRKALMAKADELYSKPFKHKIPFDTMFGSSEDEKPDK